MRRLASALILWAFSLMLVSSPEAAWWGSGDTLLTIDGTRYSAQDFKRWWGFWKEPNSPFPQTPEPYIDWLLLTREAERMQLGEDPSLQRQVRVFLQSRALLLLKQEAVDGRIKITDEEVKARYEKSYTPRWSIQRLDFQDEGAAAAARKTLASGSLTVEELSHRPPGEGGPVRAATSWLRPSNIDPGWEAIFRKLSVGDVAHPVEEGEGKSLFRLKEQKGGDEEDFAGLKEDVRRELWKEKEDALTRELLAGLYKKYEVKVDEERLEALDVNARDETFTDAVVISTSRQKFTEKDFIGVVRRLVASRPAAAHASRDAEETRKLKAETVNNIIALRLTDWEALDRHYEQKEPFKWEYDFSVRHRSIGVLEARLFGPETAVTDSEVKEHYEKYIERYTQPELVKVVILEDTQGPVEKVWKDVAVGGAFRKVVREHFGRDVWPQEVPFNHLDPAVKEVVAKLAKGDTSQPFTAQGTRVVVHLVERTPAKPLPLEVAAKSIREGLEGDKVKRQRKAYLELLKSRSKIEVKDQKWKEIQKEMQEENRKEAQKAKNPKEVGGAK